MTEINIEKERYDALIREELRLQLIEEKLLECDSVKIEDILMIIGSEKAMSKVRELKEDAKRQLEDYMRRREEREEIGD